MYAALSGVALIDETILRPYLEKRKQIVQVKQAAAEVAALKPVNVQSYNISVANMQQLVRIVETLELAKNLPTTIKTYKNDYKKLLQLIGNKPVETLTSEELRRYMLYCNREQQLAAATLNNRLNAVKYYFENVLHREKFFVDLPRAQKPIRLPNVFAENELGRLFNALQNKKHKAILFTP